MGFAVIGVIVSCAWQVASWELANANLQEDMRDMASQAGTRVGFVAPPSDQEIALLIMRKARDHGIELALAQVTVRRTNPGEHSTLYLAADYTVPVNLGPFSFRLHFRPATNMGT
ncbi:MAG TPA: hypothetical protein VMX38_05240 [Verrucomicrobiae bacterium]|nr:hypothetical protein [Verrucomicrobiae bacterium]